jgi:hypothetical protein
VGVSVRVTRRMGAFSASLTSESDRPLSGSAEPHANRRRTNDRISATVCFVLPYGEPIAFTSLSPTMSAQQPGGEEIDIGLLSLSESSLVPKHRPAPMTLSTNARRSSQLHRSPSVSSADPTSPLSPTRLKSRGRQPSGKSPNTEAAESFFMEGDKVADMRRWIVGFAVGTSIPLGCFVTNSYARPLQSILILIMGL